jgi:hypothetical protein
MHLLPSQQLLATVIQRQCLPFGICLLLSPHSIPCLTTLPLSYLLVRLAIPVSMLGHGLDQRAQGITIVPHSRPLPH